MKYVQVGVDLLPMISELTKRENKVLLALIQNIDKGHNYTEVEGDLGLGEANYRKVLVKLERLNIIKRGVVDASGVKRIMVNPKLVWNYKRSDGVLQYCINVYYLGSAKDAYEVSKLGKELGGVIDAETGELYSEYQHRLGELIDHEKSLEGMWQK